MGSSAKTAVLFPGQGSQYIGMGSGFLEGSAEAGSLMQMAEEVSGFPIGKLCLEGPMEELTRAAHLQPALTAVNLICWQAVQAAGVSADFFAGHSLGEYSALHASGVLSAADTMKLVTERGRLMEREGNKNPGGMRAVLGLTLAEVEEQLASLAGKGIVTAANHNSEKQIVISGEHTALDAAAEIFSGMGGRVIPLQVSVANHSPLVKDAVPDFEEVMRGVDFQSPAVPVLFNVTAAEETDPDAIRSIMARQIASKVRWFEIINDLLARGVDTFIEVGPKSVLTGLLKKIVPKGTVYRKFQIDTPEGVDKYLAAR
jgi:[acyl-carrier-protein] S-malonyltransferase